MNCSIGAQNLLEKIKNLHFFLTTPTGFEPWSACQKVPDLPLSQDASPSLFFLSILFMFFFPLCLCISLLSLSPCFHCIPVSLLSRPIHMLLASFKYTTRQKYIFLIAASNPQNGFYVHPSIHPSTHPGIYFIFNPNNPDNNNIHTNYNNHFAVV